MVSILDLPEGYEKNGLFVVQVADYTMKDLHTTLDLQEGSNRMFVPGMHTVHVQEICARPQFDVSFQEKNGVYTDAAHGITVLGLN